MQRRRFLIGAGAEALGLRAREGASRARPRIGLQLYTVRSELARDLAGTLARVAAIGYREVEFAGYFGHEPAAVRQALERAGLDSPSTHVDLATLRGSGEAVIRWVREIGHRYLICASVPAQDRRSLDDYRRLAASLDRQGEACRDAGLRFGFHNHDHELTPLEGRVPYDLLLEATDPRLVTMELDVYWAAKAGRDPVSLLRGHPDRFRLLHLKDMDEQGGFTEVGRGVLDVPGILRAASEAGVEHVFVEQDRSPAPLASAAASFEYLRRWAP